MSTQRHLIEWKTNAWRDPGMVANYSERMVMNQGTNQLKNRLEVEACLTHATGERVLDVGIGTGRGSLPLAARGMQVTGVDSSQAMLDECQRLAAEKGLKVVTQVSQLDCLPFAPDSFDTLVSLNVLMHFPHWKQILPEWSRVVRPGGRLIFDLHSLDHYRAALGRQVAEEELLQAETGHYVLRVAAEDLVAEAERNGLAVATLLPYGAFLGGGNRNYLLGALEDKGYWSRLLSFMAEDPALFELALLLEQELIARLTTTVTGRFMAVLEKRDGKASNQAWRQQNQRLEECLRQVPVDQEKLAALLGRSLSELRRTVSAYLATSLRSRRLFAFLTERLVAEGRLAWSDLVTAPLDSYFSELATKRREDQLTSEWSQHAARDVAGVARLLEYGGDTLAGGLEYSLAEPLLIRGLGRLTGVHS